MFNPNYLRPGHVHNFYIQNIRNNKNHRRTPKWAQRYGLVNTDAIKRKERKSQWAARYNERLPHSALEGQPLEDGEIDAASRDDSLLDVNQRSRGTNQNGENYWGPEDESYYGQNGDSRSTNSGGGGKSGGRWHYPANFEETLPPIEDLSTSGKKKKKVKKDRWARTEDAYSLPDEDSGRKKKKKKKKNRSTVGDGDSVDRRSESTNDFPEDAEGGLYGERYRNGDASVPSVTADGEQRDTLEHEF